MYDIAVVGGGVGGLSLAFQLAQAAKSVVVFEAHTYPFHKVCGEYVAMESWPFLERLGMHLSDMDLPRITELIVSSPSGKTLSHHLDPGGFGISRYTLDAALAELAKASGAEVLDNTKVTSVRFDGTHHTIWTSACSKYQAKVVIGAHGKRSNLDTHLKRPFMSANNRYVAVKYHVKADLPDDRVEFHNFQNGYCGISKVDDDRYCLCYLTTTQNLKASGGDINEMERKILMQNPFLRQYLMEFPSLYSKPCVIGQVNFSAKSLVDDHVLMLGDAAGLIAPLSGNGMSMAMNASALLAPMLVRYLDGQFTRPALESNYQSSWRHHFRNRLLAGRMLQSVFGHSGVSDMAVSALKNLPFVVNKLVDVTHGPAF